MPEAQLVPVPIAKVTLPFRGTYFQRLSCKETRCRVSIALGKFVEFIYKKKASYAYGNNGKIDT